MLIRYQTTDGESSLGYVPDFKAAVDFLHSFGSTLNTATLYRQRAGVMERYCSFMQTPGHGIQQIQP